LVVLREISTADWRVAQMVDSMAGLMVYCSEVELGENLVDLRDCYLADLKVE
jgi:hypothetical protein